MMASAMRMFRDHTGKRAALVHRPGLTDLLCGRLYDRSRAVTSAPVFTANPDLFVAPARVSRGRWGHALDTLFQRVLSRLNLTEYLDRWLVRIGHLLSKRKRYRLVYVDSSLFSYAKGSVPERMLWKETPNAVAGILDGFSEGERPAIRHPQPPGRFHAMDGDRAQAQQTLRKHGIIDGRYVVIEPATNREWFGDLRAWPFEHWQTLVAALRKSNPDIPVVRVGVGKVALDGVIDLGDMTTFREAAAIIAQSALFIGTEGGLMHATAAVDARAVIIWGGVTRPDFAGYPDRHVILFNEMACTHCGCRESCPFDAACIKGVSPKAAIEAVRDALAEYRAGIRDVRPAEGGQSAEEAVA